MKKISILYPNEPSRSFNFEYYLQTHMPRAIQLLSAHHGYKGVSVERGIGSVVPNTAVPFIAMCHYLFDSVESFVEAFSANASELQGDIPNYTDIVPVIQFNEVLIT